MKTDNRITNKTEYAEMVRGSIAPHILSEAANHTFEKRRSPVATWAAVACFALIFAAAILLIKPMTERGEAVKGTAAPDTTKIAQTTPDACFTPVPTPDISNMRIIYGSGDACGIDDMVHEPGTVTLYGGLREMLADDRYQNCVFAVDIYIEDCYLSDKHSEEGDRLYAEFQNDPAVMRYNELYESFVRENADRYGEFLEMYYYPSEFHGDFDSRKKELEWLADKYDESIVFQTAFGYYLNTARSVTDGPYLDQLLLDYEIARHRYQIMRSELWRNQENRPEEAELLKARHDAEVERLKSLGLISKEYVYDGKTMLYWLLTRDQLLNFPVSPEFAYIVTPAANRDDAPSTTPLPSKPIGSGCDPYCMENWDLMYSFFMAADENGVTNGEKCFKNYDPTMTAFWGAERGSEADSWLTWKTIGTAMPDELYLTDIYLAGTEDAPLQLIYLPIHHAGYSLESFICENVTFDQVSIDNDSTVDCDSTLQCISGIHAVYDAILRGDLVSRQFDIRSDTHCRCESNGRFNGAVNDRLAFTVDLTANQGGSVGVRGSVDGDRYTVSAYAVPAEGCIFVGWYDAEGSLISTEETIEISYLDSSGTGVRSFTGTARFSDDPIGVDPWYLEEAWRYAECANRLYGFRFTKDAWRVSDNAIVFEVPSSSEETYDCQELFVFFSREERKVDLAELFSYAVDAPIDYSTLTPEEREALFAETRLLSTVNVTEQELLDAGYTLDGTEQDYLKIAEYCGKLNVARLMSCSENNPNRCIEANAGNARRNNNMHLVDYRYYYISYYLRPAYPMTYVDHHVDSGCIMNDPSAAEYPGFMTFTGDVIISKTADGWRCELAFNSGC